MTLTQIVTPRLTALAALMAAGALVLGGCAAVDDEQTAGSGSESSDNAPADGDAPGGESEGGDDADTSGSGTATIGDTTYEFTSVILCEFFDDGTVRFDLELIALGEADDGSRVQLDAYQQVLLDLPSSDISWSGPEGLYETDSDATVTVSGSSVTGSGVMTDSETQSSSLNVSFDIALPSETTACR